jgi:hypothetical protein
MAIEKYQPPQLPEVRTTRQLVVAINNRLQLAAAPAPMAYQVMRAIRQGTELEIVRAYKDAQATVEHLKAYEASETAIQNAQLRANNFDVYLTQLSDVMARKVITIIEQSPTTEPPGSHQDNIFDYAADWVRNNQH